MIRKLSDRAKVELALAHLRAARDLLKVAGNKRTLGRVRSAISSCKGAVRIQQYREQRLNEGESDAQVNQEAV